VAREFLETYLCQSFASVHVDREALLGTVGAQHRDLRALTTIVDSPMRRQVGCQGCHNPMDGLSGFLIGINTALFGSSPTGLVPRGELYLRGGTDLRGQGVGLAELTRLAVTQPEFPRCLTRKVFESVVRRRALPGEEPLLDDLTHVFERAGRRLRPLVRAILLSRAFEDF
jgi:hypothetical protein